MTVDSSIYPNLNSDSAGSSTKAAPTAPPASSSQSQPQQSRDFGADVPHARMKAGKFDLSPYCNVGLIDSVSRLTSPLWAIKTILRPSAKIMWRALFLDDITGNLSSLLSALSTNTPINEVPLKRKSRAPPVQQREQNSMSQSAQTTSPIIPAHVDTEQRSWTSRAIYFFAIGLPLAALVGLAFGLAGFVQAIFFNILNVFRTISRLYHNSDDDLHYYRAHPNELPERRVAIDAALQQVVSPYVSRLIAKKIPILGSYVAPVVEKHFSVIASRRVNWIYDQVEKRTSRRGSQQNQSKRNL